MFYSLHLDWYFLDDISVCGRHLQPPAMASVVRSRTPQAGVFYPHPCVVRAPPSALPVAMGTREPVKGSPGWVPGLGQTRRPPALLWQHFMALSLTSWKRQRGQIPGSLTLSWFECLTYWWSTDFESLGSRRHWDSGGPEGTAAISGPSGVILLGVFQGESSIPTPILTGWVYRICCHWILFSFETNSVQKDVCTFYSVKMRFEA